MKTTITCLCCLLAGFIGLQAQQEVPLSTNEALRRHYLADFPDKLTPPAAADLGTPKEDCTTPMGNLPVVDEGGTITLAVRLDTSAIIEGDYVCVNCNELRFGTAMLVNDSLRYQANSGINAGIDTIAVAYCTPGNTFCSDTAYIPILARRPGRMQPPVTQLVNAGEMLIFEPNISALPGELRCNYFLPCEDDYEGRDQLVYFTDYSRPTAEFVYRAGGFRGVDTVCVAYCDVFGICDTFRYAFRVERTAIRPPFFDDFSYAGPYPDARLWVDRDVYVNRSMAIDPPSIGVATFDGLNFQGSAYGGSYDRSDFLTSTYINLENPARPPVLSFWLQRGGLADRPEVRDSMVLEFRNRNGEWETVGTYTGLSSSLPINVRDTFAFYSVTLPSRFQHGDFQFRFVNYADRLGIRDNWNLDYVRLDDNLVERSFPDIAFTKPPAPILLNYTSMPWGQFQAAVEAELRPNIEVGVFNHAAQTLNASPSSVRLLELVTGIEPFQPKTLFNGLESNIPNGVPLNRTYSLIDDPNFPPVWSEYVATMSSGAFDGPDSLRFRMTYQLSSTAQINGPGYEGVLRNDTVSYVTIFDNYYAYDDGTAESALETSSGRQVAVAFEANVADSLRGVSIHFPFTSTNVTDQEILLRVWTGQLGNTDVYNLRIRPFYASTVLDTLQGFTSYPLLDANGRPTAVPIPAGTFYIGWQQLTSCDLSRCVAIGYDRNNPTARANIFVNNGDLWEPITGVTDGALMLRPIMGDEPVLPTDVDDPTAPAAELTLRLFPNPATDQVQLRWNQELSPEAELWLFNAAGQVVKRTALTPTLSTAELPSGLYWIKVVDPRGRLTTQQKLIIQH